MCHRAHFNIPNAHRYRFKKDTCKECGFVPIHKSQLHLDHIDGDTKNNKKENFQTLCANCHQLKTTQNKEWLPFNERPRNL